MAENKITFDTAVRQGKYFLVDITGVVLKSQEITTSNTTIEHALSRTINGFIVLTKNTDAIIYEVSRNKQSIVLKADKTVTADIMII